MQTYDYSNSHIRSLSRPMTAEEKKMLVKVRKEWTPKPRTPEQEAANNNVRAVIARLYEDGVARTEIARATKWSIPSIAQKVRAAVANGDATGQRAYRPIEKQIKEPAPPSVRHLTEKEAEWLRKNAARMPRTARGYYRWDHTLGDKIARKIGQWASETPSVSLDSIGEALGMSRQAVTVLIRRHVINKPHRDLKKPRKMTQTQFDTLAEAYAKARPWGNRRIRWASRDSAPLIRAIGDLYLDGVSLPMLAEALDLEPNSVRNGLTKSGVVLRVTDLPGEEDATETTITLPDRHATDGRTVSKRNPKGFTTKKANTAPRPRTRQKASSTR